MIEKFKLFTRGDDRVPSMFETYKGKIPLNITSMAAIFTANVFFDMHFLGMSKFDAYEFEGDCLDRVMAILPDEIEIADYIRALNYTSDWINAHPKNFMTQVPSENGRMVDAQEEGYTRFGAIRSDIIALIPIEYKKFLNNEGFNADMVIKQLADKGYIICGNERVTRLIKINNQPTRMIVFDRSKLEMA